MEQFEQLLTCAICLDRYRNPKLLPCQHSFCMEPCMDGLVDYVRRQVKCPECRAEHRIPYQGVQAFPTNVTLQRFLELHIEITGELPDPTSGQTMERCGVCSEKSYCSLCVHCDKKCCPECKDAHMDILRREITRINSQIRRGLHRLEDALALAEKNTLGLQTNCASVAEEVDEIYRRLGKALKDRTEHLRNEIERYSGTEIRSLIQLKENLELEIANIQSNCDLADAHINENVPWDDAELLDTKELFLRTIEFIRNFEYEAGDYGRRMRFVMAHDPNQLVLHVAGYGELNIKPETNSGGHLGTTGGLAPPGGSPGLMRSKSDHRLASQYRQQQEEERLTRNRYAPDYDYDTAEYEAPRNKSRYRSRFMRHRDGDESDGDSRSTVRFTSASTTAEQSPRERVLDTEDAARGPLSGIFRLTDSPRVMKKLQECERAGKRKKEEPLPTSQPSAPKPQVQVRKTSTPISKQTSEDDEISKIKKQNKNTPAQSETVEERQPIPVVTPIHTTPTHEPDRDAEDLARRTSVTRRSSSDKRSVGVRSASSDSSTGSESSTGSGIRNTGAPFSAEEMKQKYLSRAPPSTNTTTAVTSSTLATSVNARDTPNVTPTSSPRPPFQSRFLGGGSRVTPSAPSPVVLEEPAKKKKDDNVNEDDDDDDDDETTSSSEETETESEEESDTETHPTQSTMTSTTQERTREAAMARTDIGPLLARSAEARRGSKEDSPSNRYLSPRGSPAHSVSSPTSATSGSYTSRFVANAHEKHNSTTSDSVNTLMDNDVRSRIVINESDKISPKISVNNRCSMSVGMLASNNHRLLDNDTDDDGNDFSTNIEIPNIVIDLDTDVKNEQTLMTNKKNHISNTTLDDDKIVDSNEQDDTARSISIEHIKLDDDKINDFVTNLVRDCNRSRGGFERDTRFGSDGEQREMCDNLVSDEFQANIIEQNKQNCIVDENEKHGRILTSIVEESNEAEDNNVEIRSFENKKQKDETTISKSTSNTDLKLIEEQSEVEIENLSEILSSVVESAKLMEVEYLKIHESVTKNNIDEWKENSPRISVSVNNLFDDQGWVVTDEDFCDGHEIVSPNIPHSSINYSHGNIAKDKTDYFTNDHSNMRNSPDIDDNGLDTTFVLEENGVDDDNLQNGIPNGELCSNSGEITNWLEDVGKLTNILNIRVPQMSNIESRGCAITGITDQNFVARNSKNITMSENNLCRISNSGESYNYEIVTTSPSSSIPESSQSSLLHWNIEYNNQTGMLNSANILHDKETIIDQDNDRNIGESVWFVADALESNPEIVLSSNKLMKVSKNLSENNEANGINTKKEIEDDVSGNDDNDHSWSILGEINGDNTSSYGSYEVHNDFVTTDESNTKQKNKEAIMRVFNKNHDTDGRRPTTIPMQMVTTVICVSVLCYGVLTNLFL